MAHGEGPLSLTRKIVRLVRVFVMQRRSLSCVGILACSSDHSPGGYLWLIDATGAYRVQSHAVGGGSWSQDGNVASLVNEQLAAVDFTSLSKEQGVKELLEILANHTVGMSAAPRVEMATVGAKPRRGMERQFATSSLFGVTQ